MVPDQDGSSRASAYREVVYEQAVPLGPEELADEVRALGKLVPRLGGGAAQREELSPHAVHVAGRGAR